MTIYYMTDMQLSVCMSYIYLVRYENFDEAYYYLAVLKIKLKYSSLYCRIILCIFTILYCSFCIIKYFYRI